jgi:GAF domain-containing protein
MNNSLTGDKDQSPGGPQPGVDPTSPRLAEGELLRSVVETLSPCLDEDELLTRLPQLLNAWMPHDAGLIARYQDGSRPHLHIKSRHGLNGAKVADRLPVGELLDPWDVSAPVRIDDVEQASERVADVFSRHHLRSLLVLPLGDDPDPQVVIVLAAREPGAFAGLSEEAIARFRQLVGAPVRNAVQFGDVQRARDETLHLAETLYEQVNSATGDELMQKLLQLAREMSGADAGSLMVVLPDSAGLYVRAVQGIPTHIPVEAQLPWGDHALDALGAMSAPLRLDDLQANPAEPFGAFARAQGFGGYLGVSVRRGGHLVGLLNLYARGPRAPRAADGRRIALVAQAISQALEQDRLRNSDRLYRALRGQFHQHKDDLFELLAHQLRTPLTSIKGFAQLLLRRSQGSSNENVTKYLETVLHEANRLSTLVTNVLDISQLERALIDTTPHPLDLSAVLRMLQTHPDVAHIAETHPLRWDVPAAPVLIQGDAPGLSLGLIALLQRIGAEAPPEHPLTVALTATPDRSHSGNYPVTLTVQGGEPAGPPPNLAELLRQLDLRAISGSASAQWSDLALYTAVQLLHAQGADLAFDITADGTLAYVIRFASPEAH